RCLVLPVAAGAGGPGRRGLRPAPARRARHRDRARALLRARRRGPRAHRARSDAGGLPPRSRAHSIRRMTATADLSALAARIEELFERATSDLDDEAAATVEQALALLDDGSVRVAGPSDTGWQVNEWAKKAI